MSLTADLVAFFLRQEPGVEFTAGEVQTKGGFASSQNVYAQLAILAQPGGPFMRERKSGIYHYRVRPGFDLSEYHKASRAFATKPPAAPKPAAAQASTDKSAPAAQLAAPAIKPASPPVVMTPKAEPAKPTPERSSPFLPLDDPNPVRAEAFRIINDLRQRRDCLDETIHLIELRFGVKT